MIAIEAAGTASGRDAIAVVDDGTIVAPGQIEVEPAQRQRIDAIGAKRRGPAVEIDTRIERILRRLATIRECARPRDNGDAAIRQEVAELRALREVGDRPDKAQPNGEPMIAECTRCGERELAGRTPFALSRARAVDESVAFLIGFAVEQDVRDAAPFRVSRVRLRLAAGREPDITGSGERRALGRVRLVRILAEYAVVDVETTGVATAPSAGTASRP